MAVTRAVPDNVPEDVRGIYLLTALYYTADEIEGISMLFDGTGTPSVPIITHMHGASRINRNSAVQIADVAHPYLRTASKGHSKDHDEDNRKTNRYRDQVRVCNPLYLSRLP